MGKEEVEIAGFGIIHRWAVKLTGALKT